MRKIKVLKLSPYFNTFVNDQIADLSKYEELDILAHFHVNLYSLVRNKAEIKRLKGDTLGKKNPKNKYKFIFFPGLPKNIFDWLYPRCIYLISLFLLKGRKFDIIHAHTLYPSGVVAMYLAKKWDIPFIVTSHGIDFYRCLSNIKENRGSKQYNIRIIKLMRQVLISAERVVAVSPMFSEDIKRFEPKANIQVIENSFNNEVFLPGDKVKARNKLGLDKEKKIILTIGNYVKSKGHVYLIQAMKKILETYPNAILCLIGQGMQGNVYQSLISELNIENSVKLIKHQKHGDLKLWYQSADVFAFPSIDESFGIVLLEAMACKLPVVAAASQGPSHIINNNKNGLLVQPGNVKELAESLLLMIEKKTEAKKMADVSFVEVKKYSHKEKEILKLYKNVLDLSQ